MAAAEPRLRVLFLCTGNSCRSQMAEGWARALKGESIDAYSAGTHPQGVNPLAVRAMSEVGIDISTHASKHVRDLAHIAFDCVVTVCDSARESCPIVPRAAQFMHQRFDDPPRLARAARSDDEAMIHYRRVRDEIRAFIETLPAAISNLHDQFNTPSHSGDDSVTAINPHLVHDQVREGYGRIARNAEGGCCGTSSEASQNGINGGRGGGCCGPAVLEPDQVAAAVGYAQEDLARIPEGANLGLSCGNPTAIAALEPGEVVLDLGSGGGFDCFIAGPKVGKTGRVIGVDMTADMLSKARNNINVYRQQTGLDNVEFRMGEIEHLPVADASVDVVISNCVLNLSPDKPQVWREIARVLKPGGRVAVSDLALVRPLPQVVKDDVEALIGCIAGAVLIEETRAMMQAAGLSDIQLTRKGEYIDSMTDFQDPLYASIIKELPPGSKASDFITSLDIAARKPGGACCGSDCCAPSEK